MLSHPLGYFEAEVIGHAAYKNDKGNLCCDIKFKTEHGLITALVSFTEKAVEYSMKKIRTCGYISEESLMYLGDEQKSGMIGKKVEIQVITGIITKKDGTEEEISQVGWINSLEGKHPNDVSAAIEIAKQFDYLLKKKSPAAPAVVNNPTREVKENDIPFD